MSSDKEDRENIGHLARRVVICQGNRRRDGGRGDVDWKSEWLGEKGSMRQEDMGRRRDGARGKERGKRRTRRK